MSKYNVINFSAISKFAETLPEEYKEQVLALVCDGYLSYSTCILQAAIDAADTVSHSVAIAISMQCSSLLQASGVPRELQNTIGVLPFEGSKLFSAKTGDTVCTLKHSHATLHSLGAYTSVTKRKPFRP